jgi:hypothetical protein
MIVRADTGHHEETELPRMKRLSGSTQRRLPVFGAVPMLALAFLLALVLTNAAGAAAGAALPSPCALLGGVHPEATLAPGKSVTGQKLTRYGTGPLASETCSEKVGALPVYLSVSHNFGGFGGIRVTSTTHPSGLGSGDELVVGTGAGNGSAIDFIVFHKTTAYVDLSANGASPASLTALARQVYKLLH